MKFFRKETNGDRIRSMTDEELMRFCLSRESNACVHCMEDIEGSGCTWAACSLAHRQDMFMKWLSSESETMKYRMYSISGNGGERK